MISFTIITSTPAVVRNFLIARGIIQQITGPEGQTQLVGVLPGLEWVEVPNPIVVTPASGTPGQVGYVPPVMDSRHVYLVKFAQQDENDQTAGITQTTPVQVTGPDGTVTVNQLLDVLSRTKFGAWVKANATENDLNVNGTTVQAWQIGTNTWVALDTLGLFGVWQ